MLKVPMRGRSRPLLGPGLMITAAFIGPGTITTCTLAGSDFGYTLLWVLVFASLATFVLQEMSGRLAIIGGIGLGEALDQQLHSRFTRFTGILIIICAVGAGNAAYQTGNFLGASLGLAALTGTDVHQWPVILGIISFLLLWLGSYKTLERVLGGFVALMSLCFVLTAMMAGPEIGSFLKGMFIPRLSEDSLYVALGLVGTTIVPYNLFLYSSIIRETWSAKGDLRAARFGSIFPGRRRHYQCGRSGHPAGAVIGELGQSHYCDWAFWSWDVLGYSCATGDCLCHLGNIRLESRVQGETVSFGLDGRASQRLSPGLHRPAAADHYPLCPGG